MTLVEKCSVLMFHAVSVWHVPALRLPVKCVCSGICITWAVLFPVMFLIWNRMCDEGKELGGGGGLASCNCSRWGVLSWSVMKSYIRRGGSIFLFSTTTTHLPTASRTLWKDKACSNYTVETQCSGGCGAPRAELQLSLRQINSTHNYSSRDYAMQINEFDNLAHCTMC